MNRRTALILTSMTLFFLPAILATAVPKAGLAQSNPLIGTWKINLAKSKFAGPPPMSLTLTFTGAGQNLTSTAEIVDAQGRASKAVYIHIYDGKPHPTTGVPGGFYDLSAYTRIDANTVNYVRFKDGKTVETGSIVVSADGKIYTATGEGATANGERYSVVNVYDRQ